MATEEEPEDQHVEERKKLSFLEAAATCDTRLLADALSRGEDIEDQTPQGATALILSCAREFQDWDVMVWLLENGANVNQTCKNGDTALHWACYSGEDRAVEVLLNYKANLEAVGNMGNRPLHVACSMGHVRAVALLLEAGAATTGKNTFGNDPMRLASTEEVRSLLTRVNSDKTGKERKKIIEEMEEVEKAEIALSQMEQQEENARLVETRTMLDVAKIRRDAEDAEEDRLEEEKLLRLEEDRLALEDIELQKREEEERLRREEEEKNKKKKKKGKGKKK